MERNIQLHLFKHLPEKKLDLNNLSIHQKHKRIGPLQRRLYAFYIDFFVATFFAKASILSYWMILKITFPFLSQRFQATMLKNFSVMEIAMIAITFFGHHALSQVFKYGQTLGKVFFELSTIDVKNPLQEVPLSSAFKRSFVLTASLFFMPFLALIPMVRKDQRSVHSWISGLDTVSLEQSKELKSKARQQNLSLPLQSASQLEMNLRISKSSKELPSETSFPIAA